MKLISDECRTCLHRMTIINATSNDDLRDTECDWDCCHSPWANSNYTPDPEEKRRIKEGRV